MLLQLLTSWKNAIAPNSVILARSTKDSSSADVGRSIMREAQAMRRIEHTVRSNLSISIYILAY